jgi:hypothetical protein
MFQAEADDRACLGRLEPEKQNHLFFDPIRWRSFENDG